VLVDGLGGRDDEHDPVGPNRDDGHDRHDGHDDPGTTVAPLDVVRDAPAGDLPRFATALDRLARHWLWWIFVARIGMTIELSGHQIGIYPFAWILGPLIVLALRDLRRAVPAPAAPAFTVVVALATVTAVVDLTASLLGGHGRAASLFASISWALVMLGLGLFSWAMVRWAEAMRVSELGATGAWLGGIWRRSAGWCWAGLVGGLGVAIVRAAQLWSSGRPVTAEWDIELGSDGMPSLVLLILLAIAVAALGSLFSVAGSTGRTRRVLVPPVVIRPRRRLGEGG
jgi:hypothetical protein